METIAERIDPDDKIFAFKKRLENYYQGVALKDDYALVFFFEDNLLFQGSIKQMMALDQYTIDTISALREIQKNIRKKGEQTAEKNLNNSFSDACGLILSFG